MREYFGQAGHFIGSRRCRFHVHTHVRGFCVSTVGEYFPTDSSDVIPTPIGADRLYETMVFRLDEDGEPVYSEELDMRAYNDRADANLGHEEVVRAWEGCVEHDECRANYEMARACAAARAA